MAVKSGFFNSIGSDRLYDADDINLFFDGFVTEGVLSTIGASFTVAPSVGMSVSVGTGKAWFRSTWLDNSASKVLSLSASNPTQARYDYVVLDFNKESATRANTIIIVEGTPAPTPVVPTLIDDAEHVQIPICLITVPAAASSIVVGNIQMLTGTGSAPFCTGLLQQATLDDHFATWYSEFSAWLLQVEIDLAAIDTGDVFTELADIRQQWNPDKNLLINAAMHINQRTPGVYLVTGFGPSSDQYPTADRWAFDMNAGGCGVWDISNYLWSGGQYRSLRLECTTPLASLAADSYFRVSQHIEAGRLAGVFTGDAEGQSLTLTFDCRSNLATKYFVLELVDVVSGWSISESFEIISAGTIQTVEWVIPASAIQVLPLDTSHGATLNIWMAAGSNYTSGSLQTTWGAITTDERASFQENTAAAVSNYFEFWKIQLEKGGQATPFNRMSMEEDLRQCQRYYEKHEDYYFNGACDSTTLRVISMGRQWLASKRVAPTLTMTSAAVLLPSVVLSTLAVYPYTPVAEDEVQKVSPSFSLVPASALTTYGSYPCKIVDFAADAEITT